jgi:predicted N-acetyltransferase YhbS
LILNGGIILELRLVRNDELKQAVALADSIFRSADQSSMGDAFPYIFEPGRSHSFGAFDGERLVSFMGFVPSVIRVGLARLQVFSMGSVCTHVDYRGQGIAGKLLDLCKKHAYDADASLIFVSGTRSLYSRADCFQFGKAQRFTLDEEGAARLKASLSVGGGKIRSIRLMESGDAFAQHRIADSRSVAFEQSITDLARLTSAEAYASCIRLAQETLVALTAEGDVEAYAVIAVPVRDNGKPSAPLAIEWGGPAEAVAALLADAVERFRLTRLEAPMGWHERQLAQLLAGAGLEATVETGCGTVYVVNANRFWQQAAPYYEDAGVVFFGGKGEPKGVAALTPDEKVSLMFDPDSKHRGLIADYSALPLPNLYGLNYI